MTSCDTGVESRTSGGNVGLLGGMEASSLSTIALSANVNRVINTAIGFGLFLIAKHWFPRQMGVKGISMRGITMAAILLAIAITSLLSRNLEASIQRRGQPPGPDGAGDDQHRPHRLPPR